MDRYRELIVFLIFREEGNYVRENEYLKRYRYLNYIYTRCFLRETKNIYLKSCNDCIYRNLKSSSNSIVIIEIVLQFQYSNHTISRKM